MNDIRNYYIREIKRNNLLSLTIFIGAHVCLIILLIYLNYINIAHLMDNFNISNIISFIFFFLFIIPVYMFFSIYRSHWIEIRENLIIFSEPKLFKIWENTRKEIDIKDIDYFVVKANMLLLFNEKHIVIYRFIIPNSNNARVKIMSEIVECLKRMEIKKISMGEHIKLYKSVHTHKRKGFKRKRDIYDSANRRVRN